MKSFQDILMEKMDIKPTFPPSNPPDLDPAGLSYLLGQVGRFQFKSNFKYKMPAPNPRVTPTHQKPSPSLKKIRQVRPAHKLSDRQKISFQFFAESGFSLEADFSADELKYSFRKLALKFHPDRGGHAQIFISLKYHHDILKTVFDNSFSLTP